MAKKPKAAPSLLTLMDRIYRRQTALDQRLTMIVKTQGEIIERLTPMMVVNSGFPRVNFVGEEWGSGYCETRLDNSNDGKEPITAGSDGLARIYDYIGGKGDVGHSPPVWCQQHLVYCTDTETSEHKYYSAGPRNAEMDGKCQSMSITAELPRGSANGHDRAPPRSITLCADRDSHEPNKPCQVCEWRG